MATYAPNANSEPCARLICSISPTMSMKPSAISANNRPSVRPLRRCGRRSNKVFGSRNWHVSPRTLTVPVRGARDRAPLVLRCDAPALGVDGRHLLVGGELALAGCRIVGGGFRFRPADDLEQVGVVGRLGVA